MQSVSIACVIEFAQGSVHQLEGLSAALMVLGPPEFARIADMVRQKALAESQVLR